MYRSKQRQAQAMVQRSVCTVRGSATQDLAPKRDEPSIQADAGAVVLLLQFLVQRVDTPEGIRCRVCALGKAFGQRVVELRGRFRLGGLNQRRQALPGCRPGCS